MTMSVHSCCRVPRRHKSLYGIVLFTLTSLALSGCGGAPSQSPTVQVTPHSVTLSWTAAASPVSGYAVYRSTADPTGPFYPLTITLPGTTSYTDTNVVAGETYFYTLTAFDSANLQSLPSYAISATIPSP